MRPTKPPMMVLYSRKRQRPAAVVAAAAAAAAVAAAKPEAVAAAASTTAAVTLAAPTSDVAPRRVRRRSSRSPTTRTAGPQGRRGKRQAEDAPQLAGGRDALQPGDGRVLTSAGAPLDGSRAAGSGVAAAAAAARCKDATWTSLHAIATAHMQPRSRAPRLPPVREWVPPPVMPLLHEFGHKAHEQWRVWLVWALFHMPPEGFDAMRETLREALRVKPRRMVPLYNRPASLAAHEARLQRQFGGKPGEWLKLHGKVLSGFFADPDHPPGCWTVSQQADWPPRADFLKTVVRMAASHGVAVLGIVNHERRSNGKFMARARLPGHPYPDDTADHEAARVYCDGASGTVLHLTQHPLGLQKRDRVSFSRTVTRAMHAASKQARQAYLTTADRMVAAAMQLHVTHPDAAGRLGGDSGRAGTSNVRAPPAPPPPALMVPERGEVHAGAGEGAGEGEGEEGTGTGTGEEGEAPPSPVSPPPTFASVASPLPAQPGGAWRRRHKRRATWLEPSSPAVSAAVLRWQARGDGGPAAKMAAAASTVAVAAAVEEAGPASTPASTPTSTSSAAPLQRKRRLQASAAVQPATQPPFDMAAPHAVPPPPPAGIAAAQLPPRRPARGQSRPCRGKPAALQPEPNSPKAALPPTPPHVAPALPTMLLRDLDGACI